MDDSPHYLFLVNRFCNYHHYILNNVDYCDKNIVDLLCICYIILDLDNPVSSPGLLLVNPANHYI